MSGSRSEVPLARFEGAGKNPDPVTWTLNFRPLKFVLNTAKGTKPFEQRMDALDASQGNRLQKRCLLPWDVLLGLSQKMSGKFHAKFRPANFPSSSSLEIQTAGKLTLALVGKEGNMNSCQLI